MEDDTHHHQTKKRNATTTDTFPSLAHRLFDNLHGWMPDDTETETRSEDELYMEMVAIITRSKQEGLPQGHMGALIVLPACTSNNNNSSLLDRIVGAATNLPLYGNQTKSSDRHAEINALGQACQACHSTTGATAYITISPCRNCFAALVAFGITRIVTFKESPPYMMEAAMRQGIQIDPLTYDQRTQINHRVSQLMSRRTTATNNNETPTTTAAAAASTQSIHNKQHHDKKQKRDSSLSLVPMKNEIRSNDKRSHCRDGAALIGTAETPSPP